MFLLVSSGFLVVNVIFLQQAKYMRPDPWILSQLLLMDTNVPKISIALPARFRFFINDLTPICTLTRCFVNDATLPCYLSNDTKCQAATVHYGHDILSTPLVLFGSINLFLSSLPFPTSFNHLAGFSRVNFDTPFHRITFVTKVIHRSYFFPFQQTGVGILSCTINFNQNIHIIPDLIRNKTQII